MFKYLSLLTLCLAALVLAACQSEPKEADSAALTRPLPSAAAPTPDASETDLNRVVAGVTAPDFALEAMSGETIKLANYRGQKTVVLVFYRGYF
jgi:cytochrome oxidase Cu insertion factor (SCO1/SenC/PrrC family)